MTRRYVPRRVQPPRSNRISTWMTHDEKAMVEEAAALSGDTIAAFTRDIVLSVAAITVERARRR